MEHHLNNDVVVQYNSVYLTPVCLLCIQPRPESVPYREALLHRRVLTSSTESREGLTQQVLFVFPRSSLPFYPPVCQDTRLTLYNAQGNPFGY